MTMPAQAAEPVSLGDLARAYAGSQAMDRDGAVPPRQAYRAGRFDGYLLGLAESLQEAGSICIAGCMCDVRTRLDPLLDQALADPALNLQQAAAPWLTERLRAIAPCTAR